MRPASKARSRSHDRRSVVLGPQNAAAPGPIIQSHADEGPLQELSGFFVGACRWECPAKG